MERNEVLDIALQAALHAWVAERCQRAYVHELRNGLQGIYASMDVLHRIADGKAPASMAVDKVKELARKALQSHEQGITRAVSQLTLQHDSPANIDVASALRELCSFLGNDAAAHDVIVNISSPDGLSLHARPSKFRVALLAIVVRAIDSMEGGGQLDIGALANEGSVQLELKMQSNSQALNDDRAWRFREAHEQMSSADDAWRAGLAILVEKEKGTIESSLEKAPRDARSYSNQRIVRLILPAMA